MCSVVHQLQPLSLSLGAALLSLLKLGSGRGAIDDVYEQSCTQTSLIILLLVVHTTRGAKKKRKKKKKKVGERMLDERKS